MAKPVEIQTPDSESGNASGLVPADQVPRVAESLRNAFDPDDEESDVNDDDYLVKQMMDFLRREVINYEHQRARAEVTRPTVDW